MSFQGNSIFWVEVDKIVPNPYQPRREFNEESLKELSDSIRMYGILQPLTVSRKEVIREDGTFFTQYELIAGERRLRASKMGGIEQVPVIIREGEDSEQEKLELAIIENLQREDLNAVDRALAFKQLAETFGLSHAQVAGKVGRSREYVSNSIRLLNLPEHMLNAVRKGDINEGHGRTLLMLNDRPEEQDTVFREIMLKKLSVREVERIARKIATDKVRKKNWAGTDPELIEIERQFTETLGTRVQIQKTDFGGKLTIDYFSQDDLEVMLNRLRVLEAEKDSLHESEEEMNRLTTHTGLEFPNQPQPLPPEESTDQVSHNESPAPVAHTAEQPSQEYEAAPLSQPQIQSEPLAGDSPTVSQPAPESTHESLTSPHALLREEVTPPSPSVSETVASGAAAAPAPTQANDHQQKDLDNPPAPAPEQKDDSDDNLYSIRNFSV